MQILFTIKVDTTTGCVIEISAQKREKMPSCCTLLEYGLFWGQMKPGSCPNWSPFRGVNILMFCKHPCNIFIGDISYWGLQCLKLTPPPGWDVSPWHFFAVNIINYRNVYVYVACTHLN